ncbi:xanthine dehydrogenase family protein molybdopterin-binding subunit [Afifella sp. YEN Y35]|uniref:xanthine dehydrogenase family protein molybdopterin-binding subunit n=1 Tax=Afifella sp. YEN Y35 TaxID=3388337 RepID=UPI0039DF7672
MSEIAQLTPGPRQRHGSSIGQPLTRADGRLKVTGAAIYAADNHPDGLLHAVIVPAKIARGRVTSLDVAAARAHQGVVEVMTPENRPPLAMDPHEKSNPLMFRMHLLSDPTVRYAGEPIAVVIAETLEAAKEGAALLAPRYEADTPEVSLDAEPYTPEAVGPGRPADATKGDVDAGFAAAAQVIEAVYETPPQYHNAMEPHAVVARFDGDSLFLDMPTQGLAMSRMRIAGLFGLNPENIHIRSPFLGGGFGSKGSVSSPEALGILAAQLTGRPVKLVLAREEMFGPVGHRGQTRQTVRLGLDAEGALTALDHLTRAATSRFDEFLEPSSGVGQSLYNVPALHTAHEGVRIDIGTPSFMRAPGEASGSIALESAIDEAAYAAGMDPLAFRLKNYAEVEPISGKPFSSKALKECYREGAERFGWAGRPLQPRQMRDPSGRLLGWGMATAIFPALMFQGNARAVLRRDGTGVMEAGAHDMGQGAWTAFAQIAADSLGLPVEAVDFRSGTSDLPDAGLAGGSSHTATAGNAIHRAGAAVIDKLASLAVADERSPLFGAGNVGVVAREGRLTRRDDETATESFSDILTRAGLDEIAAEGQAGSDAAAQEAYAMHAHGAVFAEVAVDPELGQIRVNRLIGAFAAGRVINPRMVESQYLGGMIWGLSFALHEKAVHDRRTGRIVNANFAEYRVPVNADIQGLEAILVPEEDPHVNPLGIKGVGEIGITGTGAALANAIFHATGKRVRSFPIGLAEVM